MIRISQVRLPIEHTKVQLEQKILKILNIPENQLLYYKIAKQSIDARKKPQLCYVYAIDVSVDSEDKVLKKVNNKNIMLTNEKKYQLPVPATGKKSVRPVIVGAGPAGLFCAYTMICCGIHPIVLERGRKIEERTADVAKFWETGVLDVSSNVQFGEGGAGTFSDGKLNTLIKDPSGRNRFVLETFVKFGAPERILYENKPHIGTDILVKVIQNMRVYMEEKGAEFWFGSCMTDFHIKNGTVAAVEVNHDVWVETDCVILAIGHSARDTFRMLAGKQELAMEAKAFAVGFRVEHPQKTVNLQQYGEIYAQKLPAAPYKVTANFPDGRGVYSFCMCPGGYVVDASSEEGRLAVNGMSYSGRDGKNANSAIIVSVTPEDFAKVVTEENDALLGVRFQEILEARAFAMGGGKIPQQLFGDFCDNRPSVSYGAFETAVKGKSVLCNLRGLLPAELEASFIAGMHQFARAIPDFDRRDTILSGVESRTSSPIRITRDEAFVSTIKGIYPCGEGAGYAGGIMSAAMDGLKVAEAALHTQ